MIEVSPIQSCSKIIENWDDCITSWSDNYYANNEINGTVELDDEPFLKGKIKEICENIFKECKNQYDGLSSNTKKIEYIKSLFFDCEYLKKETDRFYNKKFKSTNEGGNGVISTLKEAVIKLEENLHKQFEELLFLLSQVEDRDDDMKMKLSINRAMIVHLFVLLKDAGYIPDYYSDGAIGKLLENNFLYINDKGKHKPLIKIEKYIRNIRSMEQYAETSFPEFMDELCKTKIKFN